MIIKYNLFDIGGEIIKNDEYGIIKQNDELNSIVVNSVLLYKDKTTKKIRFHDHDCIYFFVESKGVFEIGNEVMYVHPNDLVLVYQGVEHRVINIGDVHMKYLIFKERV